MNELRILVVEDDPNLGQILKEYLDIKGYNSTLARDGEEGFRVYQKGAFDLCIFDIMMPKMDGFTLAEKVRTIDKVIPIIFLTARGLKEDAIHGFKIGADDYMTKPFSMEELLLRIQAIMRRVNSTKEEAEAQRVFNVGNFIFQYDTQMLFLGKDERHKLTSKEAELLRLLCMKKNKMLDRSIALKKIWLDDNYFNSRSMDVYITKLRKYLKNDDSIQILNVHGQGFKLVELKDSND